MQTRLEDIIRRRLQLREDEGPPKVISLSEAIKKYIKPGMTIHMGISHCRPNAAGDEIVRQFRGKKPKFTLVMLGLVANQIAWVHQRLLKKVISTFCGDPYPTPGPNPIIGKAYREGSLEFEHWSILTLPLRLMAGAMGVPWMPTRSIAGSSMADENHESFAVIDDPSGDGNKLGMVGALVPDVSIIHGWCADRAGNVLLTPPYGENVFGALAARAGILVTVEKIVSTDFIRKHAPLVKIPGHAVKSVSVVPMGAHPSGLTNLGVPELPAYAEDYDFLEKMRDACRDEKSYEEWLQYWILDCAEREKYLEKLGHDRIFYLRGKADAESWRDEIRNRSPNLSTSKESNRAERMITVASRYIAQSIKKKGHKTILAGVGASNLAAWLASISCKDENIEVECMAEVGFYGYLPRPSDPYIFNHRNLHTCKIVSGIDTIMGILMGGAQNRCIGVLGAAQVDMHGNVNSTCIPSSKMFIVGSGGANDVASAASEVVVCLEQTKHRLVEKVPYITSPGDKVSTIVTDLGVFGRHPTGESFQLVAVLDDESGKTPEEKIKDVKNNTGWEIEVTDKVEMEPPPSEEELLTLRLFDPKKQFTGDE